MASVLLCSNIPAIETGTGSEPCGCLKTLIQWFPSPVYSHWRRCHFKKFVAVERTEIMYSRLLILLFLVAAVVAMANARCTCEDNLQKTTQIYQQIINQLIQGMSQFGGAPIQNAGK
ncbi:uncharacterized protein LOC121389563 [Gigantopelta aegis]|uniref:uncharacterized protein LOC121389563 n=1 Tax=Gigantopelta aegis TaxID=1735272 RepID=UPI001B88B5E8|nr:uncharacterized protein LOC121389563 [Gigantopelta aegis]